MPGRLFLGTPVESVAQTFSVAVAGDAENSPRYNIAPGQDILAFGADRVLRPMRWGIIMSGRVNARGRPVMETIINARAETVFGKSAFAGVMRCVVPADGWYEWTGKTRKKTAWRIRPLSGDVLAFAAICDVWRGPGGITLPQVATVTCAPNADVAPYHHRMGVLLAAEAIDDWLTVEDPSSLMVPAADGSLRVQEAEGVDWQAP